MGIKAVLTAGTDEAHVALDKVFSWIPPVPHLTPCTGYQGSSFRVLSRAFLGVIHEVGTYINLVNAAGYCFGYIFGAGPAASGEEPAEQ